MKLERMERIARGRRDKETQPGALRPYRELSLPMIAGMAYSTLKSGGATHDCVAFGHLLKIHVNDPIHANDTGRTAHKWPVPNWDSPTGTAQLGHGSPSGRLAMRHRWNRRQIRCGWGWAGSSVTTGHARTRQNQNL
jgi:hypothetical protein